MNLIAACAWLLGRVLPVNKKKVVISSFYGRGCSDSPKAIAEELLRRDKGLKIVCLAEKNRRDNIPEGMLARSYGTFSRILQLSTAAVWIDNCRKGAHFKKKNQFYLQTWHGFALKRIEKDVKDTLPADYTAYAMRDSAQCDLIVSGSRHMSEIYRSSFWYNGEVLETGTPRNDILFGSNEHICQKVFAKLGIAAQRRIVLYAPTFRADRNTDVYKLDCDKLLSACEARFGGQWSVCIRLHPAVDALSKDLFVYDGERLINGSMYDDVQELLCAADMVITDYSSVMFDFALTGKPCFQFATDIEAYRKDRNFYFPLEQLPFAMATDNDALAEAVRGFDRTAYEERFEAFSQAFGIVEDGGAAVRCADIVLRHIG